MSDDPVVPAAFDEAVAALRAARFRSDLVVEEIPAPRGLAPFAFALAAEVRPEPSGESLYGSGRFVLLHDPAGSEAWGGDFRIVTFSQAPLEPEIGTDPLLTSVAWSWLIDALATHGARYHAEAGTATKTLSTGFGSLAGEGEGAQIELRASWSPETGLGGHALAWAELVCMLAGLPPGSENIAVFGARKSERD